MRFSTTACCAALVLAHLTGCGPASKSNNPNSPGKFAAHWERLPDGSSFGRDGWDDSDYEAVMRCWPSKPIGFNCLVASSGPMGTLTVGRQGEGELPDVILPFGGTSGYRCAYILGRQEEIRNGDTPLVSNRLNESPRWSAGFVRKYMADNEVSGARWFRCLDVLDVLNSGSLDTLRTTSIREAMLGAD